MSTFKLCWCLTDRIKLDPVFGRIATILLILGSGKGNVEESVESARRIPPDWSFGGEVSQPGMPNYSHTAQWGTMACLGSTPIRRPLLIFGRDVENATLDHFYFFIRTYHRHPETIATLPMYLK